MLLVAAIAVAFCAALSLHTFLIENTTPPPAPCRLHRWVPKPGGSRLACSRCGLTAPRWNNGRVWELEPPSLF